MCLYSKKQLAEQGSSMIPIPVPLPSQHAPKTWCASALLEDGNTHKIGAQQANVPMGMTDGSLLDF